jgi:PadR family transcriptional regulator, regulatory protein PadR
MAARQTEKRIPTPSLKEALVLELLLASPKQKMYGLELVNKSDRKLKRGTVYVTLNRMEEKGYIESHEESEQAKTPGLPRRLYRLTGYGLRVFAAWRTFGEQLSAALVENPT